MEQSVDQQRVVRYCADRIVSLQHRPALVAVAGESGSGKSYFVRSLQEELIHRGVDFAFVNHDDFLIPRVEREALRNKIYKTGQFLGKSRWEILENWYYLDAFHEVLDKLRNGDPAQYYPYVHNGGVISDKPQIIEPKPIILLENKLFLNEMDLVVVLKVDRQKIIERKIARDSDVRTPEQTIEMHERAQGYFWDRNMPETAHIVIDNNDYVHPKVIRDL